MNTVAQPEDQSGNFVSDSLDSTLLIVTAQGDTTVGPRPANVPLPGQEPRPQPRGGIYLPPEKKPEV